MLHTLVQVHASTACRRFGTHTAAGAGVLAGIKVVELTHVMAGPTCGQLLADMGADVIKVERLETGGDGIRRTAPNVRGTDVSSPFVMMNRNKRGVALNLRSDEGCAALGDLIAGADVFVENFRTGAMKSFGVDYETMAARNPKLIYCSLSGFGQTGPYASRGGFDLIAQAMSGLMSVTGEGGGRPPVKVGSPCTDIMCGTLGALGISGALRAREITGEGQLLDTSLYEAGIMLTYWQTAIYLGSGEVPEAMGSAHPLMAPYQALKTADSHVIVGAANQPSWEKFARIIGAEALIDDPLYLDNPGRVANLDTLVPRLEQFLAPKTTSEWLEILEEAGVPAAPVYNIAEMVDDPHTMARGMLPSVQVQEGINTQVIGHAMKFSKAPPRVLKPAPRLGEHTAQVLQEMAGYNQEKIRQLEAAGVIG